MNVGVSVPLVRQRLIRGDGRRPATIMPALEESSMSLLAPLIRDPKETA